MLILGTDEAGYGPNLGPLLIAVSAWSIPDDVEVAQLDEHVSRVISRALSTRRQRDERWVLADSKQLYNPSRGLNALEEQMQIALALSGYSSDSWQQLWHSGLVETGSPLNDDPWHVNFNEWLPIAATRPSVERITGIRAQLAELGVRLESLQARAVFPAEFNQLVEQHGTKSSVLSQQTLALLCRTIRALPPGRTLAVCDKHGARNRYGELLQPHVEAWIEVLAESAELSAYRWREAERMVELRLQPRSESYLPTALASMTAKYLRELAMLAFNRFWCAQVPGLQPTAGYPVDAKRFFAAIRELQRSLAIADDTLWRKK